MSLFTYSITLTKLECGNCNIPFAIPTNMHNTLLADGDWFWCPNGHKIHYHESENTRLANELAAAKTQTIRERQRAESANNRASVAEHSRRAVKGHLTRVKKRVANGVCPCCNRSFKDLARHMAGQHPDYVEA